MVGPCPAMLIGALGGGLEWGTRGSGVCWWQRQGYTAVTLERSAIAAAPNERIEEVL
jgi:hypothetical protein